MSILTDYPEPKMPADSFDRVMASMTSLCVAVETELRAFQDDCEGDPMLHARAQALVARVVRRIVGAFDTIRAEFPAEARH